MDSLTASKCSRCLHTQRDILKKALLEDAINSLNNGKTSGLDGFPCKFYKVFKEPLRSIFCATFSLVFECGDGPRCLEQFWLRLHTSSVIHLSVKAFPKSLNLKFLITENHNWIIFVNADYLIINKLSYGFLVLIIESKKVRYSCSTKII